MLYIIIIWLLYVYMSICVIKCIHNMFRCKIIRIHHFYSHNSYICIIHNIKTFKNKLLIEFKTKKTLFFHTMQTVVNLYVVLSVVVYVVLSVVVYVLLSVVVYVLLSVGLYMFCYQ